MKEVKVLVWCDACFDEDNEAQVEGETTTAMRLNTHTKLHTLDLCQRHAKMIITPLAELLAQKGTAPNKAGPNLPRPAPVPVAPMGTARLAETWTCELCDPPKEMARTSAVGHLWAKHHDEPRPEGPTKCPDCDWPPGHQTTSQAVSTHRYRAHNFSTLQDALEGAH